MEGFNAFELCIAEWDILNELNILQKVLDWLRGFYLVFNLGNLGSHDFATFSYYLRKTDANMVILVLGKNGLGQTGIY